MDDNTYLSFSTETRPNPYISRGILTFNMVHSSFSKSYSRISSTNRAYLIAPNNNILFLTWITAGKHKFPSNNDEYKEYKEANTNEFVNILFATETEPYDKKHSESGVTALYEYLLKNKQKISFYFTFFTSN